MNNIFLERSEYHIRVFFNRYSQQQIKDYFRKKWGNNIRIKISLGYYMPFTFTYRLEVLQRSKLWN